MNYFDDKIELDLTWVVACCSPQENRVAVPTKIDLGIKSKKMTVKYILNLTEGHVFARCDSNCAIDHLQWQCCISKLKSIITLQANDKLRHKGLKLRFVSKSLQTKICNLLYTYECKK